MYHYHPTRQPLLVRDNELRIMRRLPVAGNVRCARANASSPA
ncbi:MAG: hypothetical protein U0841_24150 [Chloroflexia bacterium]